MVSGYSLGIPRTPDTRSIRKVCAARQRGLQSLSFHFSSPLIKNGAFPEGKAPSLKTRQKFCGFPAELLDGFNARNVKARMSLHVSGNLLARGLQQFVNGNVTIMYPCHKLYLGW
jgi:hypothetical protein